jgi:hypothetical protein
MIRVRPEVRAFFRRYERAADDLDSQALTSLFCAVFMSLDASSAAAISPQALLAALPRRRQLFEAIGSDGLELADISELPLDDVHTLVRTSWNLRMRNQPPRDPVCLRSTFILRKEDRSCSFRSPRRMWSGRRRCAGDAGPGSHAWPAR